VGELSLVNGGGCEGWRMPLSGVEGFGCEPELGYIMFRADRTTSGDNQGMGDVFWLVGAGRCLADKDQRSSHKAVSFACRKFRPLRCRATIPASSSFSFRTKKG